MQDVNWVALTIFVLLFGFITWLGFAAANWRKGDLDQLHEWGLGGRRFGTIVTWLLVGLHIHCCSCARLWRGGHRVLRGTVHDRDLSNLVSSFPTALARLP